MSAELPLSASETPTPAPPTFTQTYFESTAIWSEQIAPYQQQVLNDIVAIMPEDVSTLLDVGCGNGLLTNQLPNHLDVIGFDRSHEALSHVKTKTVQGSIDQLPFADGAFDIVLSNDVLEHLPDDVRQKALSEMARVAAKYVMITVPFLENLNQGAIRCGQCTRFYHVNHHLRAFSLKDSRQFLDSVHPTSGNSSPDHNSPDHNSPDQGQGEPATSLPWQCIRQVLTGDAWVVEPPVFVALKRLNHLEWSQADAALCPHCGSTAIAPLRSEVPATPENNRFGSTEELMAVYAQQTAEMGVKQPELSDWCDRRTECISLFSKQSTADYQSTQSAEHQPIKPAIKPTIKPASGVTFINSQHEQVQLPTSAIARNKIDFRKANCYQRNHLPNLARDPYFISQATTSAQGLQLASPAQTLLTGFFAELSGTSAELLVTGYARRQATLLVSDYKNASNYQSPQKMIVSGMFTIALTIPHIELSRYGYLFQWIVQQNEVDIVSVEITNSPADARTTYDNRGGTARFLRLPATTASVTPVDLSLPFYGDRIKEYTWIQQPELLDKQYVSTFALQAPEDLPQWMQVAALEQSVFGQPIAPTSAPDIVTNTPTSSPPAARANPSKTQASQALSSQPTATQPPATQPTAESLRNKPPAIPPTTSHPASHLITRRKNRSYRQRIFNRLRRTPSNQLWTKAKKVKSWVYTPRPPFKQYRNNLLAKVEPDLIDTQWQYSNLASNSPSFLMICHDQQIDRRIVQQAQALLANGWHGKVVALAFGQQDQLETYDGIDLHRIGTHHIVPNCPAYWRYQKRQNWLLHFGKLSGLLSKLNWVVYKLDLTYLYTPTYRNYPLPFDGAFYAAAKHYPAQLVIAHDLPALKAAADVASQWQAKLVYDAHELYSEQKAFSPSQRSLMDERENAYAKACDAIITVSESFAEVMARKNNVPQPNVILNVTDKREIDTQHPPRVFHNLLQLPADHTVMLYQGGIAHNRNLDNLVRGFVQVAQSLPPGKRVHLVFLGPAEPKIAENLRKIAGNLLDQVIHFVEPVSQAKLLSYTTSADFGVIPYPPCDLNTKFCMPNKMFEYIQACLPILANDLVEVGKVLGNIGGGGLITDLNTPAGVATGIQRMLARDLKRDRQKLFEVKERYCWDYESKQYLNIINTAMEQQTHDR